MLLVESPDSGQAIVDLWMPPNWGRDAPTPLATWRRRRDDQVGWRVQTTRRLLADLVGGKASRNMREQYA